MSTQASVALLASSGLYTHSLDAGLFARASHMLNLHFRLARDCIAASAILPHPSSWCRCCFCLWPGLCRLQATTPRFMHCRLLQGRGMVSQLTAAPLRESPTNQILFAHPASTGLQAATNPSTVFLLTSSPQESAAFLHGQSSPTFLAQMPVQVPIMLCCR